MALSSYNVGPVIYNDRQIIFISRILIVDAFW